MEPFRLCVALAPLAAYMVGVALINCRRRPVVVAGSRDLAGLGLGIAGLLVVGPVELLLPTIPRELVPYMWMCLAITYCLLLTLGVMLSRPRLIVYNVALDQLRPALADVLEELDPHARWAGNSIALPKLRIEFYLDDHPSLRNVSLIATATPQSHTGWRSLEKSLRTALLESVETSPNAWGFGVLAAALAMFGRMGWLACFHRQEITQGFQEMMRF
ncbi:MAG: hypothetical protein JNL96_08965 [Planctomycetaceae bacterium]|nr:hypothetical protein [Planctomycetaceae bacterium]